MNVSVDDERCAGHGVCVSICPEVFELTDDGYAAVLLPEVPAEHEEAVQSAVRRCPERAITAS